MGLFRKLTSMGTFGAVDFRSDKERIAKYGKQTNRLLAQQNQLLAMQQQRSAPPGWYADPEGEAAYRWFDGQRWTEQTSPGELSS